MSFFKRKTRRRRKNKSSLSNFFYLIGIAILAGVIWFALQPKTTENNQDDAVAFIHNKQDILDELGRIKSIKWNNTKTLLTAQLKGEKGEGTLTIQLAHDDSKTLWKTISFKSKDKTKTLTPTYISKTEFFAASSNSAPLNEPLFLTGESIFIDSFLSGLDHFEKTSSIKESISLFNEKNELVFNKPNISTYNGSQKETDPRPRFTHKLRDLKPGTYFMKMEFNKNDGTNLETRWESFRVKTPDGPLPFVKSLKYFSKNNAIALDNLIPNEPVYFEMDLDGFTSRQSKIAGHVDLRIENSLGEVIAQKPKFASFNQTVDKSKTLQIEGQFQLQQPDVYFVTFQIRDHFSGQNLVHTDRLVIRHK